MSSSMTYDEGLPFDLSKRSLLSSDLKRLDLNFNVERFCAIFSQLQLYRQSASRSVVAAAFCVFYELQYSAMALLIN